MKICVVGLGYIGLPTAAMLASAGHEVVGYDINAKAVALINAGQAHFFEPDLDMLLSGAVASGRLRAQTEPAAADVYVIAVPTPFLADKTADMSYVEAAAAAIAPTLAAGATVVLESTSPVGATERLAELLASLRSDLKFPGSGAATPDVSVAYCPERILPGQMVKELVSNDRIVGGITPACADRAAAFYRSFVAGECIVSNARTAEFVKLSENAYRDVNIAFANELSLICDSLNIDPWEAIRLANRHPRVSILQPGTGVGGHCIAVDPWFIVEAAPDLARLIRTAREVNDGKPHAVIEKVLRHAGEKPDARVACFGLTYKPDVDDIRESPALEVVVHLAEKGLQITVCDPMLESLPPVLSAFPNVRQASLDEACDADVLAFLVAHSAFRQIDATRLGERAVVDAVGIFAAKR